MFASIQRADRETFSEESLRLGYTLTLFRTQVWEAYRAHIRPHFHATHPADLLFLHLGNMMNLRCILDRLCGRQIPRETETVCGYQWETSILGVFYGDYPVFSDTCLNPLFPPRIGDFHNQLEPQGEWAVYRLWRDFEDIQQEVAAYMRFGLKEEATEIRGVLDTMRQQGEALKHLARRVVWMNELLELDSRWESVADLEGIEVEELRAMLEGHPLRMEK